MAAELTCIATRTPGPDRILDNGTDGFLVEVTRESVQQALLQALRLTPEERALAGVAARRKVLERYTVGRAITTAFDLLDLRADASMLAAAASLSPQHRLHWRNQYREHELAPVGRPRPDHRLEWRRPLLRATSPLPGAGCGGGADRAGFLVETLDFTRAQRTPV